MSITYCDRQCCRADWYQHKFSCVLGRPIDATDHLVLACHQNIFTEEEHVARKFGLMRFVTGTDKSRLSRLFRRPIVDWLVDEDEIRAALEKRKLREMLIFRYDQTNDPFMLSDKDWLNAEERFEVDGEHGELISLFEAAREELPSMDDKRLPLAELQPR